MKTVRDNIIGLFKFIALFFSVFLLPSRRTDWEEVSHSPPDGHKKYMALIGSPSEPLVPTEVKFCPRCHTLVAQLRRTKQGVEIIQHGKVLVTLGSNITVKKDGQEVRGFPVKCPNDHMVRIE